LNKKWKIINDFPDYEISNFGEVRSFKLYSDGKILNNLNSKEYFSVFLYKDKKRLLKKIHRLVLETFNPVKNMDNLQVNHINGIKTDNRLENLEWCTHSENMKHAFKNGLQSLKGEKNTQSKLTEKNIIEIFKDLDDGILTQKEISEKFNVSQSTICDIKMNRTWSYVILEG